VIPQWVVEKIKKRYNKGKYLEVFQKTHNFVKIFFMTVDLLNTGSAIKKGKKVPNYLIKEVIDGIPIYYKGYKKLLRNKQNINDPMGTGALQFILVSYIHKILSIHLDEDLYWVVTNEAGSHLGHKDNLAYDIAVYDKKVLQPKMIGNQYANVPAKLVIEVDTNIDNENMGDMEYIQRKSQKVLGFGTEKIIWIFSQSKKVLIATPNATWTIEDWTNDTLTIDGVSFNIANYIAKQGIEIV
jgi:hypothetical protein